jgi:hypothetical protein
MMAFLIATRPLDCARVGTHHRFALHLSRSGATACLMVTVLFGQPCGRGESALILAVLSATRCRFGRCDAVVSGMLTAGSTVMLAESCQRGSAAQ